MKRLYRTFKFTAIALLAISLSNCTGELTTNSSTDVDESTILASTTGLNMSLTGTYKYLLLGESGAARTMHVMPVLPGFAWDMTFWGQIS